MLSRDDSKVNMGLLASRIVVSIIIVLAFFFALRATWTRNVNPLAWLKKAAEAIVPLEEPFETPKTETSAGKLAATENSRVMTRDPNTQRTPIYLRTKALVDQRTDFLIRQKIDPWLMIHTGKMRPITLHDGRTCHYSGVRYEGSPVLVFWEGLIDPFLEDEIRHVLDSVGNECVENKIDAEVPLDEAAMLLRSMVWQVYNRMAYVDQRLRTKPTDTEKAPRRDVQYEVESVLRYVEEQEIAAKALFSGEAQ